MRREDAERGDAQGMRAQLPSPAEQCPAHAGEGARRADEGMCEAPCTREEVHTHSWCVMGVPSPQPLFQGERGLKRRCR
ncbi:hypothetical protein FLG15_07070 [Xanthomonas phaseoli pv. dieffenbachiae]